MRRCASKHTHVCKSPAIQILKNGQSSFFGGESCARVRGKFEYFFRHSRAISSCSSEVPGEREGRGGAWAADAEYSEYSGNASSRGLEIELRLSRNACLLDENAFMWEFFDTLVFAFDSERCSFWISLTI